MESPKPSRIFQTAFRTGRGYIKGAKSTFEDRTTKIVFYGEVKNFEQHIVDILEGNYKRLKSKFAVLGIGRGVYRLAKVDICTILVHIPMLEGKSSMGNFFSNYSDEISPLNQPFENSYFCIIGQNFKVL